MKNSFESPPKAPVSQPHDSLPEGIRKMLAIQKEDATINDPLTGTPPKKLSPLEQLSRFFQGKRPQKETLRTTPTDTDDVSLPSPDDTKEQESRERIKALLKAWTPPPDKNEKNNG